MRIIEGVTEMQQQADAWRRENRRIALVPTMGYFHEGHLTLMRAVRNHGDVLVISIFVNPAQFGPNEDLDRYPRDLERDLRLARELGVDVAFVPRTQEIYPDGYQTFVEVKEITQVLCGKSRPVFFRGVATVVAKLFNIVKPHAAIFGEKDFQQLMTIRRMVADLNMDVEILGHPTVREADGLAMSSRNAYLSPDQRVAARRLSQSLKEAQVLVDKGERRADAIMNRVREVLAEGDDVRIDYAELRDPQTFEEVSQVSAPTLLALAVFVGMARLIDNCVLAVPS
ncbi:MAG: pantoate--beta-alanine ligase [Syntrophobacteraceae bacterium]|nr:pantoate--beta-alanine ligase [Syntrophobacteraceae bacterium]NTV42699.1 pantoate--beta-alanine ligase [Syntrophobacteraceae bacterium]